MDTERYRYFLTAWGYIIKKSRENYETRMLTGDHTYILTGLEQGIVLQAHEPFDRGGKLGHGFDIIKEI